MIPIFAKKSSDTLNYNWHVCGAKMSVVNYDQKMEVLFDKINSDMGIIDLALPLEIDQVNEMKFKKCLALVIDVPELYDNDKEVRNRCEKFWGDFVAAVDNLVSNLGSESEETDLDVIVFISFNRNLIVLSDERMMDLTEFTVE